MSGKLKIDVEANVSSAKKALKGLQNDIKQTQNAADKMNRKTTFTGGRGGKFVGGKGGSVGRGGLMQGLTDFGANKLRGFDKWGIADKVGNLSQMGGFLGRAGGLLGRAGAVAGSGCHGAVSHRCVVTEQGELNMRNERISDMFENFPTWMGPKLREYVDNEQNLPYDMHYFGAMIAPRFYLQNEGMQDYWINPIGAWQNFMAVKECYKYLGCEENAGAWFRAGGHRHELPDFVTFLDFMDNARKNLPLAEHLKINPYPEIEKNFDW